MKRKYFAATAFVFAFLALCGNPASAHAELLSTDPSSAQILTASPTHITLHFSEPVTTTQDSLRLFDGQAKRHEVAKAFHPDGDLTAISVSLDTLTDGEYVAVWRVVSADSHPVHGALSFHVGTASSSQDPHLRSTLLAADHAGISVRIMQAILHFLILLTTITTLGAVAMNVLLRDLPEATKQSRRIATYSLVTLIAASALSVGNQGIYTNALSLAHFFDISLLRNTLQTRYGIGTLLRIVTATALLLFPSFLPRLSIIRPSFPRSVGAVGACCLAIVASLVMAGHAATGRWQTLGIILDVFHITAASMWFGGLAVIGVVLFNKAVDTSAKHLAIKRFSRVGGYCALTMLTTGLLQAWRQLSDLHALITTDYGRLVITKTALFVVITSVAWLSHGAVQRSNNNSLRRSLTIELVLALTIMVVTTVLVGTSPHATANQLTTYDRQSNAGNLKISLHVAPTKTGPTAMDITITDINGSLQNVPEVSGSLTLANIGIGPLPLFFHATGGGTFTTDNAVIPISGIWTISVVVRTNDVDQTSTSFAVHIS